MQPYRDSEDLPQKPVIAAGARGASRGEGVAGRIGAGAEGTSAGIWAKRQLVCDCASLRGVNRGMAWGCGFLAWTGVCASSACVEESVGGVRCLDWGGGNPEPKSVRRPPRWAVLAIQNLKVWADKV